MIPNTLNPDLDLVSLTLIVCINSHVYMYRATKLVESHCRTLYIGVTLISGITVRDIKDRQVYNKQLIGCTLDWRVDLIKVDYMYIFLIHYN